MTVYSVTLHNGAECQLKLRLVDQVGKVMIKLLVTTQKAFLDGYPKKHEHA